LFLSWNKELSVLKKQIDLITPTFFARVTEAGYAILAIGMQNTGAADVSQQIALEGIDLSELSNNCVAITGMLIGNEN